MFKRFRIKIIAIIMSVLAILFISILLSIYFVSYQKSIVHTQQVLKKLCRKTGFEMLDNPRRSGEYFNAARYYLVLVGNDQTILKISNNDKSGYSDQELGNLALVFSRKEADSGSVGDLSYVKVMRKKGIYVAFVNNRIQSSYYSTLLYTIFIFGCIGLVLLLIVSIWLSRWLITPVETAFQKQKQFISNASHELKTPIAIISSNADALERETGESKWVDYIRTETTRLNCLVSDLLQLATIDSRSDKDMYKKLNFSELVMSIVLPFESVAFEKQVDLNEQIEDNIYVVGDSIKLGQLLVILIDNALNYSEKGGNITIKLVQHRDKKILTVSNTGEEIPISKQELIFERFYRVDEAHTREDGNYGLGLSIAKAITLSHKGKISVTSKNHMTTFKVIL